MLAARLKKVWRIWRTKRRLLREVSPEVFVRLASEVDSLAVCAALICPDGQDLQCVRQTAIKLREEALSPTLGSLPLQSRLALRQRLIHSRQQLIHGVQGAARPTRYLQ